MITFLLILSALALVGGVVLAFVGIADSSPGIGFLGFGIFLLGLVGLFWFNGLYHDALEQKCHDAGGTSVVEVGRGHLCVDDGGRSVAW